MDGYDAIWEQLELLENEKTVAAKPDQEYNDIVPCPNCKKLHTMCSDYSSGTLVCQNCGVILESDIMDDTPEWVGSGEDYANSNPCRVGCPINPLLAKSSLSTMIQSTRTNGFMKRLHSQISMGYVERSRYHIFESITKMASDKGKLKPSVVEQAKYYYTVISSRKLSRGQVRKGLIACCILYACKNMNVPRSAKEIANMTDIPVALINKTAKIFLSHMNDVLLQTSHAFVGGHHEARYCDFVFEAIDSRDLIVRYCNSLGLQDRSIESKLVQMAKKLDERLKPTGVMECKTPSAIACGYIYHSALQLNIPSITKTLLSKQFEISIVTINKIIKLIDQNHNIS